MRETFTEAEAREACLAYFGGDDLPADATRGKYLLRDKGMGLLEKDPEQMLKGIARELAEVEAGYPKALLEDEIYPWLKDFRAVVPQGSLLHGIRNHEQLVSLSNCVVLRPPEDSISSIYETNKALANFTKRRCGVGTDLSKLRPDESRVNNSARQSSGVATFAELYSQTTRNIGQRGRFGALMLSLLCRHPDLLQFVKMKEDLTKVTGANVSVKILDEFMEAVEEDKEYILRWPVDVTPEEAEYTKVIRAREAWEEIVDYATRTAEPGLLFWDTICRRMPADNYPGFKTIGVNPCAEIPENDDTCRLLSICLKNFVLRPFTESCEFAIEQFRVAVNVAVRLADDVVDLEIEKMDRIIDASEPDEAEMWKRYRENARLGRRVGIGTHGLADVFAQMRMRYDSPEALELADLIFSTLRDEAYIQSVNLAKERGPFPLFDWETDKKSEYIQDLPEDIQEMLQQHGRRNIALLTNAPTGTVSLLSRSSQGIEPWFRYSYTRRRKLDQSQKDVPPDFIDQTGDRWIHYEVHHPCVAEYREWSGSDELPEWFVTSDQIDWKAKIRLTGRIQHYIDHGLSQTVNLPKGTDSSVVSELYFEAWKVGLKGVSIYVDGCRDGVLLTGEETSTDSHYHDATPRPEALECDLSFPRVNGEPWMVVVGLKDDWPYEVFAGKYDPGKLKAVGNGIDLADASARAGHKGLLRKRPFKTVPNKYDLEIGEKKWVDVLGQLDNPTEGSLTRALSLGLRHGAAPQFVAEQLMKSKEGSLFTLSKAIARILRKYIKPGTKTTLKTEEVNPACDTPDICDITYQEGCLTCRQCGFSKCG